MKIRSGFVSNSSSSSFIVALKKRPETADELRELFFGKLDPDRLIYPSWDTDYEYGCSVRDLSEQMFKDFERRNTKSMTLEEVAEMMEGLYYWNNYHNCYSMSEYGGLKNDYGWTFRENCRFFGADENLLNELQRLEIDEEEMREKHHDLENLYIKDALVRQGIPPDDSSQYREKFCEYNEKAYKEDEGFKSLRETNCKESRDHYQKIREKRKQVALADAKWMMDCYKDHHLAHFEYGDNHGDDVPPGMGTVLENAREVWARVNATVINHH